MKFSNSAPRGFGRIGALASLVLAMGSGTVLAQEDEGGDQIEEITVAGSQIRGAAINDALAVSIFSSEDALSNGDRFNVPSMTRYNLKADYAFEVLGVDSRVRLGVNNFTDERAPIYDRSFGFDDVSPTDWRVYDYADLMLRFGN